MSAFDQEALDRASWELQRHFGREGSIYGIKACEEIARIALVAYGVPEGGKLVLATEKGLTPIGECIAAMEEMIAALQEVDDYPAQEKAEKRARAAIAAAFGVSPQRQNSSPPPGYTLVDTTSFNQIMRILTSEQMKDLCLKEGERFYLGRSIDG